MNRPSYNNLSQIMQHGNIGNLLGDFSTVKTSFYTILK